MLVHILYKLFQIVTKNKSDKNIINIPPENVTTKILWTIRKLLLSKMTKKMLWLKWVLVGTSWQHYLIGSDTRNQIWNLRSSLRPYLTRLWLFDLIEVIIRKRLFIQFSIVLSNGMLLKKLSPSKLVAII